MGRVKLHTISVCLLIALSSSHPWLLVSQSTVRTLPGFPGPLPFHLETGYVGVGELNEIQLFYYFVESEKNPKEDPLVLWLTGGPGCSAWSGLVFEIGPLNFQKGRYDGSLPTLMLRQYSWTQPSSIIFVDSPVGTGFSYSRTSTYTTGDVKSSNEVYQFLRKWLIDHPQFLSNPLYIGGDSYSGITLPVIVQEISNGIEAGQDPILNLKGYFLGNPGTDRRFDDNSVVPYAHGMGLISDELYESTKKSCEGDYTNPSKPKCEKDLDAVDKEYRYLLCYYWANDASVRKALHIRKETVKEWQRCNNDLPYVKEVKSSIEYHLNLTTKGYRALIYSGDHDLTVPFVGTQAWIRSLNFSVVDDWRPCFVDGQVAGYTTTYSNNLTFATLKGAGHTAPEYRPKESFEMFHRWISHNSL